jgi:NitT/TauT family transport system ATP-binding protein
MALTDALAQSPMSPSDAEPALAFENIRMVYPDGTEAISDVSFDVRPGELVTIVGPSGCGKSTLLRIASGLLEQSAGKCVVDHAEVGYIFQDATLLPWRSVTRNVELLLELQGVKRDERRRLVQKNIDLVGLSGFEDHYPKRLSGGMKMRVSLARSLACNPKVFLFDEPFGALDEITRERLQDELLNLFMLEGFAGLFITHSIQEACFLSTRVMVMSARPGRIVEEFEVPFDFPRGHDVRYTPEFAELTGRVSAALRASS